jgi:hypothetical protein
VRMVSSHKGWNENQPARGKPVCSRIARAPAAAISLGVPTASARSWAWQDRSMVTNHQAASSTDWPLQSLAPLEVENLYRELLATRGRNGRLLSPKTVRGIHVVLRKALADAERLEWRVGSRTA